MADEVLLLQRRSDLFQNLLISVNTIKTVHLSDHCYLGKKAYKQTFINPFYLHFVLSSWNNSNYMCCQQDSIPRPVTLDALELQELLYWSQKNVIKPLPLCGQGVKTGTIQCINKAVGHAAHRWNRFDQHKWILFCSTPSDNLPAVAHMDLPSYLFIYQVGSTYQTSP